MTYVFCTALATFTASWRVLLHQVETDNKRGIDMIRATPIRRASPTARFMIASSGIFLVCPGTSLTWSSNNVDEATTAFLSR